MGIYKDIDSMTLEMLEERIQELDQEVRGITNPNDIDKVEKATEEKRALIDRKEELQGFEQRQRTVKELNGGLDPNTLIRMNAVKGNNMNIEAPEIRAFQDFVSKGLGNMNEAEKRALDISGSAAVLPVEIMNKLLTSEKYSDLLNRATVINQGGAGKIQIPIASNTVASWKLENSELDGDSNPYAAEPTLTYLSLGGFELYRLMTMSAAVDSMTPGNFTDLMLQLLSSEVVETLEAAFINGSGTGQPKGLSNLTWVPDTNQILTASAVTAITAADIAEAISLLPQKYARGAILLMNADMYYQVSQFKGSTEYAYDQSAAVKSFLGHEIVVSEHCSDDVVYIIDPKELYIRFSMSIQLEANRSSGFRSASVDLRALTVTDSCWNPKACVAVGLGAS